ncbi:MAG: zinc ribbon domain-containing protein [Anaerolineae bacterium]|nr:zinc ribbon domain-containing protein [Anaerolineae bacterium]
MTSTPPVDNENNPTRKSPRQGGGKNSWKKMFLSLSECPNCGETVLEEDEICKHCGYRLGSGEGIADKNEAISTKKCPNCSAILSAEDLVCKHCGHQLAAGEGKESVSVVNSDDSPTQGEKTLATLGIIISLIALFAGGLPLAAVGILCGVAALIGNARGGTVAIVIGSFNILVSDLLMF